MLENFGTVGFQVAVMLLLMGLGFLCRKVNFLSDKSVKDLSDVMLYIVTPCVVLKAFDRPGKRAVRGRRKEDAPLPRQPPR